MKKKFFPLGDRRKQRGVAVIFTLGILGLLTVIALGFASTALLNNSLSKNVMNHAYARSLAKNLALTQAMYIIQTKESESDGKLVDYRKVYTYDDTASAPKDFLWKLDFSEAEVQLFKYDPNNSAANPANNVRWQYVKDTTSPTRRIIGRYAYVVVPGIGHLDPSVNGTKTLTSAPTPTQDELKNLETFLGTTVATNSWADAYDKFRWMTFRELLAKSTLSDANDKTYLFQYKGINPSLTMKSPEAYWKDGKLYSRFNMNRTDWNDSSAMTPEILCGKDKTLQEYPEEQLFIPWLKDMYDKSEDLQKQALQIAANIIQYNREETAATVSDAREESPGDGKDNWLTNAPKYAGIGRHPMLNEVGFMIRIKADVTSAPTAGSTPENPEYEYEPKYEITIDNGMELINPFGNAPGSSCFVKFSDALKVELELRAFKAAAAISGSTSDLNQLFDDSSRLTLASNSTAGIPAHVTGWSVFDFSREFKTTDWCDSPAYTKAAAFWQSEQAESEQTKTVVFEKFTLQGSDRKDDIKKLMYLYGANLQLGNLILYHGSEAKVETQRDIALLSGKTNAALTYAGGKDVSQDDPASPTQKGWLMLFSCEAKDPLVNHNAGDWSDWSDVPPKDFKYLLPLDIRKNYPGTVFNKTTGEDDGDQHHKNSTVTGDDPAYTSSSRMETAIIRHDQMRSFWELGCISRGEAWKTLNLQKKNGSASPDFTYDNGDAVLFDQLKFSEKTETFGKVNLNTDIHQVLERLFNQSGIGFKVGLNNPANDSDNDLLKSGTADNDKVQITAQTLDANGAVAHSADTCLACRLLAVTKDIQLRNRSDLLLTKEDNDSWTSLKGTALTEEQKTNWENFQNLLFAGDTYLEKIQIVSKLMPVLRTAPADILYIVILAQSIRDIGGNTPVLVDWDGTGIETAVTPDSKAKAMFKAGYRRTIDGSAIAGLTEPVLSKTYTANEFGTYNLGSDKITGEARLVATLVRDPVKRKWKLTRVQYVE